jgi:glycine/D-amino acid oxidase-like deaminating enzyme
MHLSECAAAGVDIRVGQEVTTITPEQGNTFRVTTKRTIYTAKKVVIASGGLSLPKIASDLAFRVAKGLGVNVVAPRAALVPLLWNSSDKGRFGELSGISADADVRCNGVGFRENILFTHRGSRRFLSNYIPPYLSFRPSSASRKQLHSSTMRLFPLLDHGRKSGAIWYVIFRQSPKRWMPVDHGVTRTGQLLVLIEFIAVFSGGHSCGSPPSQFAWVS